MKNVNMEVKNGKLVITVDPSQDFGPSASGKTITVASTQGNMSISTPAGELKVGLNVYKSR